MQLTCAVLLTALLGAPWYPKADGADLYEPLAVQQTGYSYDSLYLAASEEGPAPSPSDYASPGMTPAAVPAAPYCSPAAAPCGGCGQSSCYGSCSEQPCCYGPIGRALFCCNLGDPRTLPRTPYMQCHGITAGGWISAGVLANSRGNRLNGPLGFNDRNEFNLHQLWFYLDKEANADEYGWDWGGRIDYVFGADGPDTQAFGDQEWDFGWNSSPVYGSAIPQVYGTLAWDDWTLKAGRFYTTIGYEVVQAPDNFFYSHAYTMYYGEPFTHTGFILSHEINDRWSAYGGWTNGWDSGWSDANGGSTFLGGISAQLTERASLTWAVNAGRFGNGTRGNDGDIYMNSIVFEWNLTERFTYVLQHDLGVNSGLAGDDTEWYGINQYFLYQLNECWSTGMRFEWFRDDDGARVTDTAGNTGLVGDFYEMTAGLNWKPHANLTVRPELRYDWFDGVGTPFSGGNTDQFSGGFDVIATY